MRRTRNSTQSPNSIVPETEPLTDYGEVVAPLVFEKLLAIRWGFEPSQGFVKRLKDERENHQVDSKQGQVLRAIQQHLPADELDDPDELSQTDHGHEIGGITDPDDYEQDAERPIKLPWDRLRHYCPILRTKFACAQGGSDVTAHSLGDTGAKSNIITL